MATKRRRDSEEDDASDVNNGNADRGVGDPAGVVVPYNYISMATLAEMKAQMSLLQHEVVLQRQQNAEMKAQISLLQTEMSTQRGQCATLQAELDHFKSISQPVRVEQTTRRAAASNEIPITHAAAPAPAASATNTNSNNNNPQPNNISQKDKEILQIIENHKQSNNWPIRVNRAKTFDAPQLKKVRLFKDGTAICHASQTMPKSRSSKGSLTCALCSTRKDSRHIRTECSVCNMPLCTKIHDGFEMSCLDAWHTVDALEGEQKKRQGALTAHRNELKASKKGKLV